MARANDWRRMPSTPRRFRNEAEASEGQSAVVSLPAIIPYHASPFGYGALMSVDYMACEQTKARSMASLPATVIRYRDGKREKRPAHPLARLLSGVCNEEMTSAALMQWLRLRCDTFGEAYIRVEWFKGQPVALWPVNAAVMHDFKPENPEGRRTIYTIPGGDDYNPAGAYFSDELVHVSTAITKDGFRGESLARLAAEQIGLSIDLERFYKSMLRNGNHQLGHVEVEKDHLKPDAMADLKRAVKAKAGVDNAGSAPIFAYGAKWVTDQQTMRDASLIEQQTWVLQQVCRACNVPPWKVYDPTGATYGGGQQAQIDYVTGTVLPDVRALEQAFIPVLRVMGEWDYALKFSLQGLMRGDDAARAQFYREMTYSGVYTRADVRELEDMNPIDGLEKPYFPLNYGALEPDGSVTVYAKDTAEPSDGNQTGVTE